MQTPGGAGNHTCYGTLSLCCLLRRRVAEPLFETRRGKTRVVARGKALIVQLCPEVEGMSVSNYLPCVSHGAQETPGEVMTAFATLGEALSVANQKLTNC